MATFALIHGGGGSAWDWHRVIPELERRGHRAVAVDLPGEDASAGWWDLAGVVAEAIPADGSGTVVVGHSLGGFTAPLVAALVPVNLVVLVCAMVPAPGERFGDWWTASGYEDSGLDDVFFHDVPPALAAEARRRERDERAAALEEPWPLDAWPATPTRYVLGADDRLFPPGFARRHARERLGVEADATPGGHYLTLSRPVELAERLDDLAAGAPG